MENITRIVDLPDNITMSKGMPQNNFEQGTPTNYIPMNIHPNPYGISAQNPIMPPPEQQSQQIHQLDNMQMQQQMNPANRVDYLTEQQKAELQNMQHVRLPSRDIPQDTTNYLHDEQIQPNYIPKVKLTKNFVEEYEEEMNDKLREHESKKYRESRIDSLITEFRVVFLVVVLYLLFQLPIINTLLFKRFAFLSIHNDDGNFNFYGLLFKSILFGGVFYCIQKTATFISEF